MVGLDLAQLLDNGFMRLRKTTEFRKRMRCFLISSLFDQVARCFWEDQHASDENDGPGELDRDWNAVRARIVSVVCAIVHNRCQQKTDGNCKLITPNNNSSNPFGRSFRLIERNWRTQILVLSVIARAEAAPAGEGRGTYLVRIQVQHQNQQRNGLRRITVWRLKLFAR